MIVSLRATLLVVAAVTASSVAPAQVIQATEPLIENGSNTLPLVVASIPLPTAEDPNLLTAPDDLAPAPEAPGFDSGEPQDGAVTAGATLAETVAKLRSTQVASRELECLAGAIYFESKSESLQGQLAVGHVIANRAKSGRFPSSYCGVVFQRSQFSFVRGRALPAIQRGGPQWKNAVAIATIVDQKLHDSPIGKALFFHARRVSPGWRLTRVATLGNHVFYR